MIRVDLGFPLVAQEQVPEVVPSGCLVAHERRELDALAVGPPIASGHGTTLAQEQASQLVDEQVDQLFLVLVEIGVDVVGRGEAGLPDGHRLGVFVGHADDRALLLLPRLPERGEGAHDDLDALGGLRDVATVDHVVMELFQGTGTAGDSDHTEQDVDDGLVVVAELDDSLLAQTTLPGGERDTVALRTSVLTVEQEHVAVILGQQILEDLVGDRGLVATAQEAIQVALVESVSHPLIADEEAEGLGVVRDLGHVGVVVGGQFVGLHMVASTVAFAPKARDPVVEILDPGVVAHLERRAITHVTHGSQTDLGVVHVALDSHLAGEHGQLVHEDDRQVVRRGRDVVDERKHSLGDRRDAAVGHHAWVDLPLRHQLLGLGGVPTRTCCCTVTRASVVEPSAGSSHGIPPVAIEPIRFG